MESKVVPVAQGEIKEIVSQDPLVIKIHVEVLPEVTVDETKIKKIKLIRKKISVSDTDVKIAIADIEKRFSTFKETAKKAKMEDRVTIDTDGYDKDGKIMETTSMRAYPLILGSASLVSGFEE
jgi:FKBP-type peptidyl-prolyl cis-trans isomerase (trigger factor)